MLQETSVSVTQSAQQFHWEGYGLKLDIPSLSLPSHIDTCTITLTATLSGQYQFPENTELVSPVFWLKCEPSCKFKVPLHLYIQHCAPLDNSYHLFIARATCSQKDLPYSFRILHGGVFSKHSSYGVIALDQFSGVGVVQERSDERRYLSNVFYMGPHSSRDIHFTITWHDDAHITVSLHSFSILFFTCCVKNSELGVSCCLFVFSVYEKALHQKKGIGGSRTTSCLQRRSDDLRRT